MLLTWSIFFSYFSSSSPSFLSKALFQATSFFYTSKEMTNLTLSASASGSISARSRACGRVCGPWSWSERERAWMRDQVAEKTPLRYTSSGAVSATSLPSSASMEAADVLITNLPHQSACDHMPSPSLLKSGASDSDSMQAPDATTVLESFASRLNGAITKNLKREEELYNARPKK